MIRVFAFNINLNIMTYTQNLENDILKLRMSAQDTLNWLMCEFLPETSQDVNDKPVSLVVEELNFAIERTNRHQIVNQVELFETEENTSISETEVLEIINSLNKRLQSNYKCIKSISKASLILNLKACASITNELIKELETKSISRNENGQCNNIQPTKE